MPPTVILVRHAEALHNDYSLHDPELSELGRTQCRSLRKSLLKKVPQELDIGLILVSPMVRTIETALLAFGPLVEKGIPIRAHADWQENSAKPCDVGRPAAELAARFPQVDFSGLDPVWPDKTSPAGARYAYTRQAIVARGERALAELRGRPEKAVLVVSHSGFLRLGVTTHYFFNADYRVFDFVPSDQDRDGAGDDNDGKLWRLEQWESTKAGGLGWSWEKTVQLGEGLPDDLSAA
ncbi:histidine phosphatase superfamily [Echria macrotheca]|uniref:Histidine phosphatase superfamily n=1 Tax=Echria macrotheca TaxID=438768 RepID=A0AAJ0BDL7_9PEZI|nr:histidine phosphatase superfamily [Echria macrotheca]